MTGDGRGRFAVAHDEARRLLARDRVEGLTATERAWLDAHLEECPGCAGEAALLRAALERLRSTAHVAPAELVQRTRRVVRLRSASRGTERGSVVPLWAAVALSAVWTVATAPLAWWACAWIGRAAGLPDVVWQAGFLLWWFLPATLLATVLAWWHVAGNAGSPFRPAQLEWR
jgi:anti-sigma factor RsiW